MVPRHPPAVFISPPMVRGLDKPLDANGILPLWIFETCYDRYGFMHRTYCTLKCLQKPSIRAALLCVCIIHNSLHTSFMIWLIDIQFALRYTRCNDKSKTPKLQDCMDNDGRMALEVQLRSSESNNSLFQKPARIQY